MNDDWLASSKPESLVQTPTNSPMKVNKRRLNSPAASPARKSPRIRGSPRRQISRLPIRPVHHARSIVKELNLPPDESVFSSSPAPPGTKVTPERLMQELKEQVAKKILLKQARQMVDVDDEISIPFTEMVVLSSPPGKAVDSPPACKAVVIEENVPRPMRISSRINTQIIVESPDLPFEDPLEIARQTLQNTRLNSGYRTCQLVFTNEFANKPRPDSPEHAFSQQIGLQRHILKIPDSEEDSGGKLRFNRLLHFLDTAEDVEPINETVLLNQVPSKSCLSQGTFQTDSLGETSKRNVVQVKRFIYPGTFLAAFEASTPKPRRLFGAAKRAPARNQ
jgi:hypothetical protein